MEKYKLCPACGTKNAPSLLECAACEADLTAVKVTDENTETAQPAPTPTPAVVRLCDCGVKNPGAARKCAGCGEDISDITPIPDTAEAAPAVSFLLSSLDGQYAYRIPAGSTLIGREHAMGDYLSAKPYVSRQQARLRPKRLLLSRPRPKGRCAPLRMFRKVRKEYSGKGQPRRTIKPERAKKQRRTAVQRRLPRKPEKSPAAAGAASCGWARGLRRAA